MKSSIRDKTEGTFHEVKGKVKEIAGQLSDNPKLGAKGKGEKIAGRLRKRSVRSRGLWEISESGVSCTGVLFCHQLRLHDTPQPGLRKA